MLDITALKTGKFAHPEPCRGCKYFKEGVSYPVGERMAASLIVSGWGKPTPAETTLDKMNKTELIKYANVHTPGMDESLTNKLMVKFIEAAQADNG